MIRNLLLKIYLKLYLIIFIFGNIAIWINQYNLYIENKSWIKNSKVAYCKNIYIGDRGGSDNLILACDYFNEDLQKIKRPFLSTKPSNDELKEIKKKDEIKIFYMTEENHNLFVNSMEKTYRQVIYELKATTILKDCLVLIIFYLIVGFIFLFIITHNKNSITKKDFKIVWNTFLGKIEKGRL